MSNTASGLPTTTEVNFNVRGESAIPYDGAAITSITVEEVEE